MPKLNELITAIVEGNNKAAVAIAEELVASGVSVQSVIQNGLTAALKSLDLKCTSEEFNLLELILAGRAMVDVMDKVLGRYLEEEMETARKGPVVVIGMVKGDIHDLGKYITSIVLKTSGFQIIDLGKDVEPAIFVQTAKEANAEFILVASLLSISVPYVRQIRELIEQTDLSVKIVAGGEALKQVKAENLAVDYVAQDVFDCLHYLNREAEMKT